MYNEDYIILRAGSIGNNNVYHVHLFRSDGPMTPVFETNCCCRAEFYMSLPQLTATAATAGVQYVQYTL